ncbi:NfeD family protein [Baaleninema sp.]|uniref:NfeD family protein n=1 Tax=Baaleninema sp. TaxID=3101197 RepID=UPI003D0444A0
MTYPFQFIEGFAIVSKPISPSIPGRVHFKGSWWKATCRGAMTLNPGDRVRVIGRDDITLIVEPETGFSPLDSPTTTFQVSSERVSPEDLRET